MMIFEMCAHCGHKRSHTKKCTRPRAKDYAVRTKRSWLKRKAKAKGNFDAKEA